jgi:hypothetical protein
MASASVPLRQLRQGRPQSYLARAYSCVVLIRAQRRGDPNTRVLPHLAVFSSRQLRRNSTGTGLADELAGTLADPRRSACQDELRRFARWQYDDLVQYGSSTARALDYSKLTDAPWHEIIDGLLVLREEHPLTYVHDPKPRRTNPPAQ